MSRIQARKKEPRARLEAGAFWRFDSRAKRLTFVLACTLATALCAKPAHAQTHAPAPHDDDAFDVMNLLADHGLHDIQNESWNLYGQFTYISSWKTAFHAPYTNANGSPNSLLPGAERSFTASFTLFFGAHLWPGGEAYLVPEVISEKALSGLKGLGGSIQNFELQKTGSSTPQLYRARTFLRQNIDLGGTPVEKTSDPMQLASTVKSRRLVFTAGTFTVLDVFDRNSVTSDPRQTFLNMAFMTYSSWDFAADARGYSFGASAELYYDDWAVRLGRMAPPRNPNTLQLDYHLNDRYSDALEIEHDHEILGQKGAVRLLGYRNYEVTGRFDDAIAKFESDPARFNAAACGSNYNYGSQNATAPDLCWVRRPNAKLGIGVNIEQYATEDIGAFVRAMYSDGQSEVDAFNSADRSLAFGAIAHGGLWHRHFDLAGAGFGASWISKQHAEYLALGGVDGFVGDGHLKQAAESVVDVFYSFNLLKAIWLSADYQHLWNPGFNADRGPVDIFSGRVHAEF